LELLIATILSAQCTDRQVNIVTPDLFKKYRTAADYANAPLIELETPFAALAFFATKPRASKRLSNIGRKIWRRSAAHDGGVDGLERSRPKNGQRRLGNAFGINVGIVVDTHVARLSHRLGLSSHSAPEKIEKIYRPSRRARIGRI